MPPLSTRIAWLRVELLARLTTAAAELPVAAGVGAAAELELDDDIPQPASAKRRTATPADINARRINTLCPLV